MVNSWLNLKCWVKLVVEFGHKYKMTCLYAIA